MPEHEIVRLKADVLIQALSDQEAIALDVSSEKYFEINESALSLSVLLQDGATLAQLTDRLCETFEVGRAEAAHDVDLLVRLFAEHDMLR